MGSRVMHYCISTLLAKELGVGNRATFILGGIAPDAHGYPGGNRDITHFKDVDERGRRFINYRRFCLQYRHKITEPFYLGYLCHLISDEVRLECFRKAQTDSHPGHQVQDRIYRDFVRLNGRIIMKYGLQMQRHEVPAMDVEGMSTEGLSILLDQVRQDFIFDESALREPLEIFRNDGNDVDDYISQSVTRCTHFIRDERLM